jgi:hypothetical protein
MSGQMFKIYMKQNFKIDNNFAGRVVGQLAAEKKKTTIAVILIVLMALMWIRFLAGKGPASASAANVTAAEIAAVTAQKGAKVTFIELPVIEGRNDSLSRDFFAANGFRQFGQARGSTGQGEVTSLSNGKEDVMKIVARRLKLEAIMMALPPQAFINDKLATAGDKLDVLDGTRSFEFKVISIDANSVTIGFEQSEFKLKLLETAASEK